MIADVLFLLGFWSFWFFKIFVSQWLYEFTEDHQRLNWAFQARLLNTFPYISEALTGKYIISVLSGADDVRHNKGILKYCGIPISLTRKKTSFAEEIQINRRSILQFKTRISRSSLVNVIPFPRTAEPGFSICSKLEIPVRIKGLSAIPYLLHATNNNIFSSSSTMEQLNNSKSLTFTNSPQ